MATKTATARELNSLDREMKTLDAIRQDNYQWGSITEKRNFNARLGQLQERSKKMTPLPIMSDSERQQLERRSEVLEQFIKLPVKECNKPEMPTRQEMWQTPAGAVGKHRKWQDRVSNWTVDDSGNIVRAKDGYGADSEWKDIQGRLHSREEQELDPDCRNLERLRPDRSESVSLADLPRKSFALGATVSQEQWNETVGPKEPPVHRKDKKTRRHRAPVPVELQCKQTKKDGSACVGRALIGKDYCMAHKPKEA